VSKTPLTDAIQEAFNKRNGMCVDDIVEAYEHARVLEQVVAKLRAQLTEARKENDSLCRAYVRPDDLRADIEKMKVDSNAWRTCAEQLAEEFAGDVPERNCACHINPPCNDCVEYSSKREALANFARLKGGSP
jgi:hypothetical protein